MLWFKISWFEENNGNIRNVPKPSTPAIPTELTIAQGTALEALEASSLMWTLESNEPELK